jgi:hypothetical protein
MTSFDDTIPDMHATSLVSPLAQRPRQSVTCS